MAAMSLNERARARWPTERGGWRPDLKCTPSIDMSVVRISSRAGGIVTSAASSPIPKDTPAERWGKCRAIHEINSASDLKVKSLRMKRSAYKFSGSLKPSYPNNRGRGIAVTDVHDPVPLQ